MSQVNVSHLTFDNDNTIYNLEDETARAEIAALHVELTQAEYDALTPEEKNNGTEYFITDSTDSGDFSYLENRLSVLDGKSNTLNEIATLEVTDVKGIIHSSVSPKYTFIKNKGENDCYISATDDVSEGVDGTILLQSNSTIMLENLSDVNYICNSGKTTVICICFQNSVNDPFARDESISSSGGDGALGLEEVVLWENEGSTNPDSITLSQPYTDFDEIYLQVLDLAGIDVTASTFDVSSLASGYNIGLSANATYIYYTVNSSTPTIIAKAYDSNNRLLSKIIGRRYTKVNPTGYRQVVLWKNPGTTNPQTITLSEAWSDFDELAIITDYIYQGVHYTNTNIKLTSTFTMGESVMFWYYDNAVEASYAVTSSTTFTFNDGGGLHFLYKIVGIKY